MCIEDGCNQQYRYDRETKYQLKFYTLDWPKPKVYDRKGDFESWVTSQTEPFMNKEDLEQIHYEEMEEK